MHLLNCSEMGIFWRSLQFGIQFAGSIINVAKLLHNFLVNECEQDDELFQKYSYDDISFGSGKQCIDGEMASPIVMDNNEPTPARKKSDIENDFKRHGDLIKPSLVLSLEQEGKVRRNTDSMHYNNFGHVYMTY